MSSQIFKYLLEQGFNEEEINYIDENNDYIWQTNKANCESVFEFFRDNNYSFEQIHQIILNTPIIISMDIEEIKNLIFKN